ncbi:MAG: GrpB family protein [Casimicrobiaceae bacterium]
MSPILPYAILPPVYVEYDANAPDVAARVIALVGSAAPWARSDHIGSTAIPGCAGKGIIDLVALYPDGRLAAMRDAIDALGFQLQRSGHAFPDDRPMRVGAIEHRDHIYRLHMHVVAADSDEARSLYRFRDVLRADSPLRDAYQAKKRAILQSGVNSSSDYTQAKGDFISAVLSRELR